MGYKQLAEAKRRYTGGGDGIPDNVLLHNAAPTVNVTYLGTARVGSLLIDTTNGKLYICTATNGTSTITWVSVGSQTA
jgi:hypothetical protein